MRQPKQVTPPAPATREPTTGEQEMIAAAVEAQRKRARRPTVRATVDGRSFDISSPHADLDGAAAAIREAFGSASGHFASEALSRLAAVATTPSALNAAIALIASMSPENELEAAHAEQVATCHIASLEFARRALIPGQHVDVVSAYVNDFTKLSRSMAIHAEAIAKLHNGGRQRIEVVHVNGPAHFGSGHLAYPGSLDRSGGDAIGNLAQPHGSNRAAIVEAALGLPLRSQEPEGDAVSVPGDAGQEAMCVPWRQSHGSADRITQRALSDGSSHARGKGRQSPGEGYSEARLRP